MFKYIKMFMKFLNFQMSKVLVSKNPRAEYGKNTIAKWTKKLTLISFGWKLKIWQKLLLIENYFKNYNYWYKIYLTDFAYIYSSYGDFEFWISIEFFQLSWNLLSFFSLLHSSMNFLHTRSEFYGNFYHT